MLPWLGISSPQSIPVPYRLIPYIWFLTKSGDSACDHDPIIHRGFSWPLMVSLLVPLMVSLLATFRKINGKNSPGLIGIPQKGMENRDQPQVPVEIEPQPNSPV